MRLGSRVQCYRTPKVKLIPLPPEAAPLSSMTALLSLHMKGEHLEFDLVNRSPSALGALVGTNRAKKQVQEEMAQLAKEAVQEWATGWHMMYDLYLIYIPC